MLISLVVDVPKGARLADDAPSRTELASLKPGARAIVRGVGGEPRIRRRLLEMGFVSGTPVRVVRLAPLGDPMQVTLHGYHISLRRSEAQSILVDLA